MKIENIRREYRAKGLHKKQLNKNPLKQFETWLDDAIQAGITDPTAMSLATVNKKGMPSLRTVLLKSYDNNGFVFFTHLKSRKVSELKNNHQISLLFPWNEIERQVIVMGEAEFISTAESLKYFLTRPKGSQLAAWASQQSHPIASRQTLEEKFKQLTQEFKDSDISLPPFWGGIRIKPLQIEFWQGRVNRLHDRFMYSKFDNENWEIERLSP